MSQGHFTTDTNEIVSSISEALVTGAQSINKDYAVNLPGTFMSAADKIANAITGALIASVLDNAAGDPINLTGAILILSEQIAASSDENAGGLIMLAESLDRFTQAYKKYEGHR